MRVVDLNQTNPNKRITVLSYGASRAGKTRFAGSFPRPLFLSDNTESGWNTLKYVDPSVFFEPSRKPDVWAIEKAPDMMQAISQLETILREEPGKYLTVVVDSLTFYADLYFNWIEGNALGNSLRPGGKQADGRQLYGTLGAHLRELRIRIHNMNINVAWLCLERTPSPEEPIGGPLLSGQNAQKFAAGCDYVLFHRSFQVNPSTPVQWEIRTRRYGNYMAGGRDEGLIPDPLGYIDEAADEDGQVKQTWVPDCTYRTLAMALGINEQEALTPPPPPASNSPTMVVMAPTPANLPVTTVPSFTGPIRIATKPTTKA